jgi:hypothetical protein
MPLGGRAPRAASGDLWLWRALEMALAAADRAAEDATAALAKYRARKPAGLRPPIWRPLSRFPARDQRARW